MVFCTYTSCKYENNDFLKLVELLERESSARMASEFSRAAENAAFQQMISNQNATITQLNETIGTLLEEIRLLKGPKKNSGNSSIPPSKDENRTPRASSLRNSSGKSSGGQKGHEGSTLKMSPSPDHIVDHSPGFCNCCELDLHAQQAELTSCRQIVDIPVIKPLYTEHRIFRKTCQCGHQTTGTFPSGVNAPISYGPQTTSLIAYLHTRQYVPLARISELFNSVYGMTISQGTVCGILNRFAEKALPAFELIKNTVSNANVIGAEVKHSAHLFTFLYYQDVPPENNASERAIRNVKVKQKISGMFKSNKGAQNYAIIRSITDTCIKNAHCVLNAFFTIAVS